MCIARNCAIQYNIHSWYDDGMVYNTKHKYTGKNERKKNVFQGIASKHHNNFNYPIHVSGNVSTFQIHMKLKFSCSIQFVQRCGMWYVILQFQNYRILHIKWKYLLMALLLACSDFVEHFPSQYQATHVFTIHYTGTHTTSHTVKW